MKESASLALLCTATLLVLPPPVLTQVGVIARASTALDGTAATGVSTVRAISADGCVVVFSSTANDLVLNDGNNNEDVFAFVCDPPPGNIRISLRNGGGEAHGGNSTDATIMGASVRSGAFASLATDIVVNDMNGNKDIFVVSGDVDAGTPTMTRVSVPNLADQGMLGTEANASSDNPSMGGNERFVAFDSEATNLVLGDTNTFNDVFVHDRQTGATTRVSLPNLADQGMLGAQANGDSSTPVMSANGRFVAFESLASNLVIGDTNSLLDIFVHDRQTGATTRVSVPNLADQGMLGTQTSSGITFLASISADGRFVAFQSNATNLVLNDTMGFFDIFVHDRQTGATTRVSVPNLADQGMLGSQGNNESFGSGGGISFLGRYVVFRSLASNLILNDGNSGQDVFVHDRQTGATIRVNVVGATEADAESEGEPAISADGRFVAFDSKATNLAPNDDNAGAQDVFLAQTALTPEGLPIVNNGGVVNAASFAPAGPVAPGSIAAVFGTNLATSTDVALATPLPTILGEGQVNIDLTGQNDPVAVPMFFNSTAQSNVQIPWETSLVFTSASGVLHGTSGPEPTQETQIQQFAPGIFATNQQGTGQGAILIANTAMLAAPVGAFPGSQPVPRGGFLEIYWTGGGPVTNQPATGAAASANPLSQTTTTPTLTIGGIVTPVLFSGLAPGFVGLYVTTCQVPAMAPIGDAIDVILTQGGIPSNTVTIAISAAP